MKKKIGLMYLIVALISIICISVSIFLAKDFIQQLGLGNSGNQDVVEEEINILYKKPKNPTELQDLIYDNLIESTKDFPEEYQAFDVADYVVQSFIADFYTWTNKEGNFDVGGLDYIYGPNHMQFAMYARDTFYQNFNFFAEDYGLENLIEVESISTKVDWAAPVILNDIEYSAYYVEAEWTYKSSATLDVSKFQNEAYYIVIYNENSGRFEIAQTFEK